MNTDNDMDSALISRIPIVKFNGYTIKEKIVILEKYMLSELLENYGMKKGDVIVPYEVAVHLITNVKEVDTIADRSGVRGLKNVLNSIINRINLYRLASINGKLDIVLSFQINNFKLPYTMDIVLADKILSYFNDNTWKHQYGHIYI